jgi:DNA-directed RNA polymerase specialized sigma24 family protein
MDPARRSRRARSEATRALVAEHGAFVARQLRRLAVPESAVDDALQQVFLVAQAKLADIDEARERAFLFGIVVNVAAHVRRRLARRREVNEDATAERVDEAPLPDEALDAARERLVA